MEKCTSRLSGGRLEHLGNCCSLSSCPMSGGLLVVGCVVIGYLRANLNHPAGILHKLSIPQNGNPSLFPSDLIDGSSVKFLAGIDISPDSFY